MAQPFSLGHLSTLMTNQKKKCRTGHWLIFSVIIGAALGVALGNLVWWLSGAIVLGLIADMVCSRCHAPDEKKSIHDDVA